MGRLSATELKKELSEAINRVQYQGERIILHRRDKDACVLVSLDDLKLLQAIEDRLDARDAEEALKDPRRIPPRGPQGRVGALERIGIPNRVHGSRAQCPCRIATETPAASHPEGGIFSERTPVAGIETAPTVLQRPNDIAETRFSIRDLRDLRWASIDNDDSRDLDQRPHSEP